MLENARHNSEVAEPAHPAPAPAPEPMPASTGSSTRRTLGAVTFALSVVALVVTLVLAGLAVCLVPVTTQMVAGSTCLDEESPYTRDELVVLAVAARDYTVGPHVGDDLLRAEAAVLASAIEDGRVGAAAVSLTPAELRTATLHQLALCFADLPEQLVLDDAAISHLDDCHEVASLGLRVFLVSAAVAVLLAVVRGFVWGRRALGGTLKAAGLVVAAAFAVLGCWALVDFQSLFALFHGLLFAEGTWKFPWDSLLICMYPDAFWYGMAAVWVAVSSAFAITCVAVGRVLRR